MIPEISIKNQASPATAAFLTTLRDQGYAGDVETRYGQRLMGATDNSVYQVLPAAILFPRSETDLSLILSIGSQPRFRHLSVTARGGGTGTNGQSLNEGLVVDLSRHMNRILHVDYEKGEALVEPGVVPDQLNKVLRPKGWFFAPNLSPSNRATVGGMVNTDACGKGSRVYGRTSDHILELSLVLADGHRHISRPLDADALARETAGDDTAAVALRRTNEILREHGQRIRDEFPKMSRFLTGYNLAGAHCCDGGLNLNYLIAGSEGTLALVSRMRLRLLPLPPCQCLVLVRYGTFDDALQGAERLVRADPTAIETIDDTILGLARQDVIWHEVGEYFKGPESNSVAAINLLEFVADDPAELDQKIAGLDPVLTTDLPGKPMSWERVDDPAAIRSLWNLRKKGVGLLGNRPGERRPIPFVEDTAVPPENLADYIRDFRALLEKHGLSYGMFGHVDVGCLHVRPALDLKQPEDEKIFKIISDEVRDLVIKYNGIMWAEHGRGFRSGYTRDFFGPELFNALRQIKGIFDPQNRLNPGKIVTPAGSDAVVPEVDGVPMRGQHDRSIPAEVRREFSPALHCNGNGACFNFEPDDVMCPSWKQSGERLHSPKGRAGMLREWLRQLARLGYDATGTARSGWGWKRRPAAEDFSTEVLEAMDGCLACKACATTCPVHVDIPGLRARFLNHYHTRYRRPLTDYFIAGAESLHHRLTALPWIYNVFVRRRFVRYLLQVLPGMSDPPLLSSPPLRHYLKRGSLRPLAFGQLPDVRGAARQDHLILLPDAMTAFYEVPLVLDVIAALEKLGLTVHVAPFHENGKGRHVRGMLPGFRRVAERQAAWLRRLHGTGIPMVGIDPAIVLTYREEYPEVLGADACPFQVQLLQEFLAGWLARRDVRPEIRGPQRFRLLRHCTESTSVPAAGSLWQQVFHHLGLELEVPATGCCGMAGAFGHERRNLQASRQIYDLSWGPALQEGDPAVTLATGASCRSQVARFGAGELKHPLQAILHAIIGPADAADSR